MRTETLALPALAGLGVVLGAAACSGGDAANGSAPTCQILWASPGEGQDLYDVYLVEMTREAWINPGERLFSYEDGVFGMFYDEFDQADGGYASRGIATSGSFTLTTSLSTAPVPADPIGFEDTAAQSYFALDGAGVVGSLAVASGGVGTFDGEWSDDSGTPAPGSGTVTIAVAGTSFDLGSAIRYAQCYEGSSSSPASAAAIGAARRWPVPRFALR